jgi:hypothetical protein
VDVGLGCAAECPRATRRSRANESCPSARPLARGLCGVGRPSSRAPSTPRRTPRTDQLARLIGHQTQGECPKRDQKHAICANQVEIATGYEPAHLQRFRRRLEGFWPTTENRGVPGSSPGLAIGNRPQKAIYQFSDGVNCVVFRHSIRHCAHASTSNEARSPVFVGFRTVFRDKPDTTTVVVSRFDSRPEPAIVRLARPPAR